MLQTTLFQNSISFFYTNLENISRQKKLKIKQKDKNQSVGNISFGEIIFD